MCCGVVLLYYCTSTVITEETLIKKGDRIAQAVMNKIENAEIIEVDKLGDSERGAGGFGSTGK